MHRRYPGNGNNLHTYLQKPDVYGFLHFMSLYRYDLNLHPRPAHGPHNSHASAVSAPRRGRNLLSCFSRPGVSQPRTALSRPHRGTGRPGDSAPPPQSRRSLSARGPPPPSCSGGPGRGEAPAAPGAGHIRAGVPWAARPRLAAPRVEANKRCATARRARQPPSRREAGAPGSGAEKRGDPAGVPPGRSPAGRGPARGARRGLRPLHGARLRSAAAAEVPPCRRAAAAARPRQAIARPGCHSAGSA